jgi:hypothetical protein
LLFSRCFDILKTNTVHAGCTLVGLAASVGIVEYVLSVYLVIKKIEPVPGFFLRFGM